MKKLNVNIIAEIAIFAAIGWVLDFVQGAYSDFLPFLGNGGSIGIAMLVVVILALRRGFVPALACGLIMGFLDVLDGFYAYTDVWYKALMQVGLDYLIGYALVSVAVIFYKKVRLDKNVNLYLILACLVGMLGKYLAHTLSGILFWPNDAWGGFVIYSILYNGIYMIPSFILCSAVLVLIFNKNKQIVLGDVE